MNHKKPPHVLFIDNFDSFVFNLVDEFEKRGCEVTVWRNDIGAARALEIFHALPRPSLIVLSPGPGAPADAGCCVELVQQAGPDVPMSGVCLGQQVMTEACGGRVVRAGEIVHGKASEVTVVPRGMFEGLPETLTVGRYHSLICEVDDAQFAVTARLGRMAMAIEHRTRPLRGVQFHPESVLTPRGGRLIENIMSWAKEVQL